MIRISLAVALAACAVAPGHASPATARNAQLEVMQHGHTFQVRGAGAHYSLDVTWGGSMPRLVEDKLRSPNGNDVRTTTVDLVDEASEAGFTVAVMELDSPRERMTPAAIARMFESGRDKMKATVDGITITKDRATTLAGAPARELELRAGTDVAVHIWMVYVASANSMLTLQLTARHDDHDAFARAEVAARSLRIEP